VAKYLRRTIDWGLVYWREIPNTTLPDIPLIIPLYDPSDDLPAFPSASLRALIGYVDAAHANDLRRRRSTTGYAFVLAGAAIAYQCKTQTLTATSSTEAKFLAAITAGKVTKYLRSILIELGYSPLGPTILYEDNTSAIKIINAGKPTERSRHIDIQHFAIQDWRQQGALTMKAIHGILNPSDDLTKALGWILHSRHARRLMGQFGIT
jgi:hypothetical protein